MSHGLAQAIRDYLTQCRDALTDEVNHYPTPIARCDVQLTALLETRAEVLGLLREADDALVQRFAAIGHRFDDPQARSLTLAVKGIAARP